MMRQSGIIFDGSRGGKTHTESKISHKSKGLGGDSGVGQAPEFPLKSLHKNSPRKSSTRPAGREKLLSKVGTGLIIFSILGFLFTYGPIIRVELGYRLERLSDEEKAPHGSFADLLGKTLMDESEGVPDPNFSLIIPKIHAKAKVVPNVDPTDYGQYMEALKVGVAHARGTEFPGGNGTIYLFAHSTDNPLNIIRYNAVFYLLRELEAGDEVQVYFAGVKHRYTVTDKQIVDPTDVSFLSPQNPDGKELLILQTCWPPGTTLKRILVFAEKKEV